MRRRILLVAPELDLRARIGRRLQASGYAIELASDLKRALGLTADDNFQVAIVASGSSSDNSAMLLELRDTVPKMIVLAKGPDEIGRLRRSFSGLDAIFLEESNEATLIDGVREIMQPADGATREAALAPSIVRIGDRTVDLAGQMFVDAEGGEMALTRAETALLKELARNPGQILSRDQLRHAVASLGAAPLDRSTDPFDRSIDMLVARLRRKIEPDPKVPRFLVTVQGVGYKLMARPARRPSGTEPTEPERRQITALACNLMGAMGFASNFDPEDLSRVTKSFQDAGLAAITGMGGTIAIVAPDQILTFFGYPEAHEDDAERAVSAALDAVAKIGQTLSPRGEPLQARVGVATGLALTSHREAIGEPSMLATGLCGLAPPNSVMIAASTRRLLSGAFVCGNSEQYVLVGMSKAVSGCRVIGKQATAGRFKAKHSNKITGLVGRDEELHQLLALWEKAKCGEGQIALVRGEAGIGKSHLCEFLLGRVGEEPHACLRYQCSPHHLNGPFFPVISQLEHAMGFEQTDTAELKLEKLKASLYQAVEPTDEDIFLYANLLSTATPQGERSPSFTPRRQKDLTIAALSRHLRHLADKQPLIVLLADAHWIDSSTLDFVNTVFPLIKSARVLFLIEARQEFTPQWLGQSHVTMLRLERMGHEQSLAIISEVTRGKKLPPELQEQIASKADGVPLFIEELTQSVTESELVQDVGDRYVAIGPLKSLAVPTSLVDLLTARLDRLGSAKEVAQTGAVIGREFSYPLLAAVASQSANSLQAALAQLAASELISVSGELPDAIYAFRHALVQDAAYATLSRVKRQQLHSRIADVLENSFPSTRETQPELVAYHLEQAGSAARAVNYLGKAAQRSIKRSANAEAIGHLTHALELLHSSHDSLQRQRVQLPLEVMLSQAMIARYGYAAPTTRDTLLRARTLLDDSTEPSRKFAVLYGIWASHYVAGKVTKQRSAAADFLMEAEQTRDPAAQCIGHRIVGTTHVTMGDFATGLHHLERARALYDSEHHADHRHQYGQDIGASTLCYMSWALWHLGHIEQAAEVATEAVRLAEKRSHPHTLVYTICHARGFIDLFGRRYEDMPKYAGLVVSICDDNGFSHWANCGTILNGWAAVCLGQLERGIDMLRKGVVEWQEGGARLWLPMFAKLEAEANAKAGRDGLALELVDQALATCESTGERWAWAEVLRTKASLLLSTGRCRRSEIESILLHSLEVARHQQARCWELRTSCDLARLWQRQGRNKKALNLVQSVYDQFTEGFETADLRDAQSLMLNLRQNA
jgi:predicted ATPase/DNA-binding response OmpR family regulator/class 3 adenylate cyclase